MAHVHKPQRSAVTDFDQEYRAIEVTLLDTARGRWFLAEHGRRARRLDNALLEDALHRLKSSLGPPTALVDRVRTELTAVREELAALRTALTARPPVMPTADGATPAQPSPVQKILEAAENVHELAWTLQGREGQDFNQRTCEDIGRQVVAIYALSRAQAAQTEATGDLIAKLTAADQRLAALIDTLANEALSDQTS